MTGLNRGSLTIFWTTIIVNYTSNPLEIAGLFGVEYARMDRVKFAYHTPSNF